VVALGDLNGGTCFRVELAKNTRLPNISQTFSVSLRTTTSFVCFEKEPPALRFVYGRWDALARSIEGFASEFAVRAPTHPLLDG
jgi:hypothetical protein